jgi:serine/threonine-protein kinase
MSFGLGSRIGPYEVTALLGEGGMGKVYQATDTNLKRAVAVKVLPDPVASATERLARFQREAEVLARLNHPNVAAIYGLERSGGTTALVMELIVGPTLADRIAEGAIPVDEALPIARQIAEALEAAHEQGIIHRDLKPANIKLRPDGTVKVLDFGLAKALESTSAGPVDATASPTITSPALMTGVGVLLGTAAYMSPEQAKGKPAGKRADIWGFGCVLYEMLTGRRAFEGDDVSDAVASVLKTEPAWSALPADVPPAIRVLTRGCLEKDPRRRIGDMSVALFVLDNVTAAQAAAPAAAVSPNAARSRVAVYAGLLVLASAATGAAVWWATRPAPPPIARFAISPTGAAAITAITLDREIAVTPSGSHIVYVGNSGSQLFVRAQDQLESTPLAGLGTPRGPFMSPDGQWIGFFDGAGTDVAVKKVTLTGGPPVTLCRFSGQRAGGTWSEDGTVVFATTDPASGLWRVSAGGGDPMPLTTPDTARGEVDHLWPEFLPGGQAVLFTIVPAKGAIDSAQIAVLDLRTGAHKILVQGGSHGQYVSTGHIVYGVSGTLRAVAFDADRLEVRGTPTPVLSQVVTTTSGAANFVVTRDGSLVYVLNARVDAEGATRTAQRTLTWVDRQGREQPIDAPPRGYVYPRLSPDGSLVALESRDQQNDIWIWSFASKTLTRFTFGAGLDRYPAWTPDGQRVVFVSDPGGTALLELASQAANGTGTPERLSRSDSAFNPGGVSVSPDGRVLFSSLSPSASTGPPGLMVLTPGDTRPHPLLQPQFVPRNAEVSPDGRWLAYDADDSGSPQVYVRPFPAVDSGRWQISTEGGGKAVWARSGRELFYRAPTGDIMSVRVESGTAWNATAPSLVIKGDYYNGIPGRAYDVSPDATRFLVIKSDPEERIAPVSADSVIPRRPTDESIVVVQNWTEELKRLVPTN